MSGKHRRSDEITDDTTGDTPAPPVPASPADIDIDIDPGYTDSGVPTFESVREKIETRYGTSTGAVELGSETPEGRRAEEQYEARQKAAAERVEQIRKSMRPNGDQDDA